MVPTGRPVAPRETIPRSVVPKDKKTELPVSQGLGLESDTNLCHHPLWIETVREPISFQGEGQRCHFSMEECQRICDHL